MELKKGLVFRRQAIDELSGETNYGDTLKGIKRWGGDPAKQPTEEAIQAKLAEMQTEYDALEYARNRRAEYDLLNQFELISDDDVNGTTTHKDAIAAIKAKYPKP